MGIFGKPEPKSNGPAVPPAAPAPPPQSPAAAPAAQRAGTVIGEKVLIRGRVEASEPLLILGTFEGEVVSQSVVTVGESGKVKATLHAGEIVVAGEITGDCVATTRLEVRPSGRLFGSIRSPRLSVSEGAVLQGRSETTRAS